VRADWVARQIERRGVHDRRVLAALRTVPRELFVPEESRANAYADAALPIGFGQTISQPYIVALICAALELRGDELVLDVGTGSGYQAAVLSRLAREVVSIERVPELAAVARSNLEAAGASVEVIVADGALGLPDRAPFDGIAVAASAADVPPPLYAQLAEGGRLVLPVEELLICVTKHRDGPQVRTLVPARFVPLRPGTSAIVR
jgi:protein-L-isoaspartate(D-aspartate) O-methyltransferase